MKQTIPNPEDSNSTPEVALRDFSDFNATLDSSGKVLEYKPGYFSPLRFSQSIQGEKIQAVFRLPDVDNFEHTLQNVLQTGKAAAFECKLSTEQEYWLEARLVPISKNQILFVARDVTQCRQTEIRLWEAQKSNIELNTAYDATIEGLMRALDLRDKEKSEHTRRVSEITVNLAAEFGVEDPDLVHVRRGAILHDIGKIAIPDRILFKSGPLTEDEWKVMRQHPEIAVDLLSPISYLVPALEIPRSHHEKWDGTGYPNHLRGEEIPFSARLFALVDVYDALTSNRPYRNAWSLEMTLQYIEAQAGKHFDPKIVPAFVNFVRENSLIL